MILDPDNKYLQTINAYAPLKGATILEIGCGNGRITADMAQLAKQIVATDLDAASLTQARKNVNMNNIDFIHTPDGFPALPIKSFDIAIYTLSLHHIQPHKMVDNLLHIGKLLNDNGKIVVVEPGDSGSFLEVKQRYGAGSGDETAEKQAAVAAMNLLPGWKLSRTHKFYVDFQFTDKADFFTNKLPNYETLSAAKLKELEIFLQQNTTSRGIVLNSERYLNLITRQKHQ